MECTLEERFACLEGARCLHCWIAPVFDSRDDLAIIAGVAAALADETGDERFRDYFRFELEGKREIYLQRLLDSSTTTIGYTVADIMAGKYGPPGGALMPTDPARRARGSGPRTPLGAGRARGSRRVRH